MVKMFLDILRHSDAMKLKKTKYKHIRKKEEGSLMVRLEGETDFMNVQENYDVLSQTNSRSVSSELFKNYIREKNLCSVRFSELFQRDIFRKLRMNTETNTKRSESKFLKRFKSVFGAPEDVVVIFGDWEQRQGMSYGKEPTKGKSCRKLLRQAGYVVLLKDEFRTSKLCHSCHGVNEDSFISREDPRPWKNGESQNVWGLLRCKNVSCSKIHNRDFNSASNIYYLADLIIHGFDIPKRFQRSFRLENISLSTPDG